MVGADPLSPDAMRSFFAAGLLDWAARCDVAGRPEAAAAAVALAAELGRPWPPPTDRPALARRVRALAAEVEREGEGTLALAARLVADEIDEAARGGLSTQRGRPEPRRWPSAAP